MASLVDMPTTDTTSTKEPLVTLVPCDASLSPVLEPRRVRAEGGMAVGRWEIHAYAHVHSARVTPDGEDTWMAWIREGPRRLWPGDTFILEVFLL